VETGLGKLTEASEGLVVPVATRATLRELHEWAGHEEELFLPDRPGGGEPTTLEDTFFLETAQLRYCFTDLMR